MKANPEFENLDLEFWANIKLLNQRLGYTIRKTKVSPNGGFIIPTLEQIKEVFNSENLSVNRLIENNELTNLGHTVVKYLEFRSNTLTQNILPNLMKKEEAKDLFYNMKAELNPQCPLPMNKQKKEKRDFAFLTGMVNMLIEKNIEGFKCNYDPEELTAITQDRYPIRTLSRRVDGAFPTVINPKAIWEIKEYYSTTSFGSRVADGVYETQLDGWELWEAKQNLNYSIDHYLIVDDYFTWWIKGKSYLCRLIDIIHMGLVTEVIFGKEIFLRIPEIFKTLTKYLDPNDKAIIASDSNTQYSIF